MPDAPLPYKLATLCDLRDVDGRILLLRRLRAPNQGLCSPIGGKLDMDTGESPAQCAQREIREEAGLDIPIERLHLMGLISEQAFEGKGHWLLFLYRVMGTVELEPHDMPEGRLEWHRPESIEDLPLPETDRRIIWPMIRRHESAGPDGRPGFFAVHIDCRDGGLTWRAEESFEAQPGTRRLDGLI
ncbi:MAG: NUDIX domain-containing protein [Planctomycetota bacterium]